MGMNRYWWLLVLLFFSMFVCFVLSITMLIVGSNSEDEKNSHDVSTYLMTMGSFLLLLTIVLAPCCSCCFWGLMYNNANDFEISDEEFITEEGEVKQI